MLSPPPQPFPNKTQKEKDLQYWVPAGCRPEAKYYPNLGRCASANSPEAKINIFSQDVSKE